MTGHPRHARVGISLAVGLALLSGCTASRPAPAYRDRAVPALQLAAFNDCDQLLNGLRAAAKESVGPYGFGGGMGGMVADSMMDKGAAANAAGAPQARAAVPEPAAPDHSGTNTHEAGVDEPDLVKTDGKRIVTISGGTLRVIDAAARKVTGSLTVEPNGADANLLLSGDHALVLLRGGWSPDVADTYQTPVELSRLLLVDLTGTPRVVSRYTIDGNLLDARQVGSVARVVIHSSPRLPFRTDLQTPDLRTPDLRGPDLRGPGDGRRAGEQRIADNRAVIDAAPVDQWLPRYAVETGDKRTTGRVDCAAVSRPTTYSGASTLTVLTFDVAGSALGTGNPTSLVADGDTVYSNGSSLYVATDNQWRAWPMSWLGSRPVSLDERTELYRFDISGTGKPRYVAGGGVPGWLINQYAMSEWEGKLRVATTLGQPWDQTAKAESTVYVLDGSLREVGHVGGLGKGERIYGVRFVGPTGYVVTFRQTDPLYVVDLRDPATPRVTGELKINGYSAYLHPAGNGRLIGVGRSADDKGRGTGMQVSLFDVADPTRPARIAQYVLPGGYTEAEYDPHAFLYWQPTGLLVVPTWSGMLTAGGPSPQAVVLHVSSTSISSVGSVSGQGGPQIRRSLMIGDVLWMVSDQTVAAYNAGTLTKLAEL